MLNERECSLVLKESVFKWARECCTSTFKREMILIKLPSLVILFLFFFCFFIR